MSEARPLINEEQLPEFLREDYEIRERTIADIKEPPRRWKEIMRFFGPAFVILGATIGSGELISTPIMASQTGFVLLWMILIGVFLKVVIQEVYARYVIYTGKSVIEVLDEIPGRIRRRSWAFWWTFLLMVSLLINNAGIVGLLGLSTQGLFGFGSPQVWALMACIVGVAVLLRGIYDDLEKVTVFLVGIFSLVSVLIGFFVIQATPYGYTAKDLATGFSFRFPPEGWFVALAVFGATGITANEIITYSYWVRGKGYAAWCGPNKSEGFLNRALGWIRVMRADLSAGAIVVVLVTTAFFILGAAVLHKLDKVPQGMAVIETISSIYIETLGSWMRPIFYIAALMILLTTFQVNTAGIARVSGDVLIKAKIIKSDTPEQRIKVIRILTIIVAAIQLLLFYVFTAPASVLLLGQFLLAWSLPIVSIIALYLEGKIKKECPELALKGFGTFLLWISALLISGFMIVSRLLR